MSTLAYRQETKNKARKSNYDAKYYYKNKEKKREWSKKYRKGYQIRLKETKARIIDWLTEKYKDTPCMDCSIVYPWCVMDFDHRPEEEKSFAIGLKGWFKATPSTIAKVEKEIAKCDLVCSNCHRIRTWIERPTKELALIVDETGKVEDRTYDAQRKDDKTQGKC